MESPVYQRNCIDIKASCLKHSAIVSDLPAIHALSGCDTVAATFGIGKITALSVASKGYKLDLLGDVTAEICQVTEQATSFMAAWNQYCFIDDTLQAVGAGSENQ